MLVQEGGAARSSEFEHVEVVEWHEVPIATEDIHVALGVLHGTVAVASSGLPALDETKFTLMCLLRAFVQSRAGQSALGLALLHALVISVETLVGILNNEGAGH